MLIHAGRRRALLRRLPYQTGHWSCRPTTAASFFGLLHEAFLVQTWCEKGELNGALSYVDGWLRRQVNQVETQLMLRLGWVPVGWAESSRAQKGERSQTIVASSVC